MVAPKIPRARFSIFAIIFGAFFAVTFTWCLGWNGSPSVLGIGLTLDIMGAAILAIPDIPSVHRRFFSGKLNEGLDTLSLLGDKITTRTLFEPDTEQELRDRLTKFKPSEYDTNSDKSLKQWVEDHGSIVVGDHTPSVEGFHEFVESFEKKGYDVEMENVYGIKSYRDQDVVKYVFMKENGGGMKMEGPFSYELHVRRLEDYQNELESRFRRLGLSILIIGFSFQGISLFLS